VNLLLVRRPSTDVATIGELFDVSGGVASARLCYILEDVVREPATRPVGDAERVDAWVRGWKVPGKTAIPTGTYRVIVTPSARFKRLLPLLVDVPGFTGIRIHPGNTHDNTEGCLLPGRECDPNTVWQSRIAFDALYDRISQALLRGDRVSIAVRSNA
jgi:hypothetical protein